MKKFFIYTAIVAAIVVMLLTGGCLWLSSSTHARVAAVARHRAERRDERVLQRVGRVLRGPQERLAEAPDRCAVRIDQRVQGALVVVTPNQPVDIGIHTVLGSS